MREAGSDIEQTGAVVTVVERQIDELLKGMAKKETAGVLPKPRAKRERKEKKGKRRVVVTGMGAMTPLGLTVDEYWKGLLEGRSGIGKTTLCDVSSLSCQISGEVKGFDPKNYMEFKEARRMARFSQFAVASARMAIADAKLDISKENQDQLGVILGNGIGGFPEAEEGYHILVEKGGMRINPFFMPMILPNMAAGQVSLIFGLTGFSSTVVTACAASAQAIGDAVEVIRLGKAEVMFAGGSEAALTPTGIAGFCVMKALSTQNDEPTKASRPFDAKRDGFVPAEGAAILILESLDHAMRRDAHIYAEIAGIGVSSDAYHIVAPHENGAGAIRAMRWALEDAKVATDEVEYINAHGTSTPLNDMVETIAIKSVFGDYAYRVPISSTKSMIGHLLGASGAAEAVACIKTIAEGMIHPTINHEYPDPDCDLDYVPNVARKKDVRVAISNSFGFGGQNACLVFKKFEG
jgi:3-oxoacyl-[acyl-carrier-protein] synthase II